MLATNLLLLLTARTDLIQCPFLCDDLTRNDAAVADSSTSFAESDVNSCCVGMQWP